MAVEFVVVFVGGLVLRRFDRVTTGLFRKAIDDGPDATRALRNLIHFESGSEEVATSTEAERLEARLRLLTQVADTLEANPERTLEKVALELKENSDRLAPAE